MVSTTNTFKHPVVISDWFYHEISLLTNGNVAIVHGGNDQNKLAISIIDPSGTLVSTSDLVKQYVPMDVLRYPDIAALSNDTFVIVYSEYTGMINGTETF